MSSFCDMARAVGKPSAYPEFVKYKRGRVFGYGVLIFTLYFILRVLTPVMIFQIQVGGFSGILEDGFPVFQVSKEGLWVEEPRVFIGNGMFVRADPGIYVNPEEVKRLDGRFESVFIMDGEKLLFRRNQDTKIFYYREFGNLTFGSRDVQKILGPVWWFLVLLFLVISYLGMGVLFFFGVLMLALMGKALARLRKAEIGFGQLYILALYGRTFSLLLKGFLSVCGIRVPFFWVLNFGLTLLYMDGAVRGIRDDFTMKF